MSDVVLQARDLYRFFHAGDDEVVALRGVTVSAARGEMIAVTGPSGSGKSTLLSCLAGLDEPDGGHVVVGGQQLTRRSERARAATRARYIGVTYQSGNLVAHLNVEENIRAAQYIAGVDDRARRAEVMADLGIERTARALPRQLSGGEAARAALAAAIVNRPLVLIADEPTGELDTVTEHNVLEALRGLAASGCAVVVATHSEAVAGSADRRVALVDGAVVS